MGRPTSEGLTPSPGRGVQLALGNEALVDLPGQRIKNHTLVTASAIGEFGLTVQAIPSSRVELTRFWKAVGDGIGKDLTDDPKRPRGAQINYNFREIPLRMRETAGSPDDTLPQVVMEPETTYGLHLALPPSSFTAWTGELTRQVDDKTAETYRERKSLGVLMRIDGDTPLREYIHEDGSRYEKLLPLSWQDDWKLDHTFSLLDHRAVDDTTKDPVPIDGLIGRSSTVRIEDLEFPLDSQAVDNTAEVTSNIVDLIVVRTREERITKRSKSASDRGMWVNAPDTEQVSQLVIEPGAPLAIFSVELVKERGPKKAKMRYAALPK